MAETSDRRRHHRPPGIKEPRRFVPKLHYELLACGVRGHQLLGSDVAELRPEDRLVAREIDGTRWLRCVRCDSWLPLPPPEEPVLEHIPPRDDVDLPLRGRPLRDKIVLRAIAIDRAFHFVVLGLLALAVFLFASDRAELRTTFYKVLADVQGGVGGGPIQSGHTGITRELDKLFSLGAGKLHVLGLVFAVYAAVEGAEAVGLWFQQRWAEYLTFLATTALLPLEVYELTKRISWFKIFALVLNIVIVIYLLWAKRLFGFNGGARAEREERERDIGWAALERTAPP